MKVPGILLMTLAMALMAPSMTLAAGGGGMSSPMPQSQPSKTPQQMAVDSYNQGIAARDKAHELENELAAAASEKAAGKLQRKITKQYEKAVKRFRSAIKHEPRLYQAHGSLGYALKQTGDYANAMLSYDECLTLKPEYTPAIEYRAEAYLGLGRFDEVIQAHEYLGTRDAGHQQELKVAIAGWLTQNSRNESNGDFYDWAMGISGDEG